MPPSQGSEYVFTKSVFLDGCSAELWADSARSPDAYAAMESATKSPADHAIGVEADVAVGINIERMKPLDTLLDSIVARFPSGWCTCVSDLVYGKRRVPNSGCSYAIVSAGKPQSSWTSGSHRP